MKRVFVSGYGLVSAYGKSWAELKAGFESGQNAVCVMKEWEKYEELATKLAAPILNYAPPSEWNRKQTRSLGKVALYSVEAATKALEMAGLLNDDSIKDGRMGVAAGSSTGSTDAVVDMAKICMGLESKYNANTYIKMMPHTTAANIAVFYGLKGRLVPTSSACTSGSQAIGYAYEMIKFNRIEMMIAGGAEELCHSEAYTFDVLYATSQKNSTPKLTPQPFDAERDGLVIGEGAGYVILESEDSLRKRGGTPIAEVVGFGSTCDGTHMTRPQKATMKEAMRLALMDAGLNPDKIGYINAHATATKQGDIAESIATSELFGEKVCISSLKSYLGHTLGACGGLESIASIEMMRQSLFYPTLNLNEVDKECASLDYLVKPREIHTDFVMNNNFAFGGVNTSLIFKRI